MRAWVSVNVGSALARRSVALVSLIARNTRRSDCRAASASAWLSHVPSSHVPNCSFATSRPGNLDQRAGAEIVSLFEDLNREIGVTVLVVTHDPVVARRTRRTIRLVDGAVVYDGPSNAVPAGLA